MNAPININPYNIKMVLGPANLIIAEVKKNWVNRVRIVTVCSMLLKKIILFPPSEDHAFTMSIEVTQWIVIIAVHRYIYNPIDLIWDEEIRFFRASKLVPPAALSISSADTNLLSKIRPVANASIKKIIEINVKKIMPDSLNVDANCLEISEPRNAPNDPPAAMTPKTLEAPSPRNRLIITTQKIETTKKE